MEEKQCKKCGRTLPIGDFTQNRRSKDGYSCICRQCLHESKEQAIATKRMNKYADDTERPLAMYTPRQLMEELRRRGYDGELTFTQHIVLSKL